MRIIYRILKFTAISLIVLLFLIFGTGTLLYFTADRSVPELVLPSNLPELKAYEGYTSYGESILHKGDGELWELHLKGTPAMRGLAFGELCKDLMYFQEKAFINQIKKIVPSEKYLSFLKYITIIYNRNISSNIPPEYREEIYTSSFACSSEFDFIGKAYDRQLNYHAAHDLGHAMQEYMLVGCSSFAVWGGKSADSSLLIGRNFDFYVGDDFAKNKIVSFFYPDKGYKFASVGWAGMVGVLSGMNEKGLTITLNAAKSSPPLASKTPISIIARHILQYASNIEEAYNLAMEFDAFVSESLLIGSAGDGKAAIIEKDPHGTYLYEASGEMIISTNHFQSANFRDNHANKDAVERIEGSHSQYRFDRLSELISQNIPLDPEKSAGILRNPYGLGNKNIGWGNEKSLNQFIAHHAVIFQPEKRIMWVSIAPWQLGKMVAYDLNEVFSKNEFSTNSNKDNLSIGADSAAISSIVPSIMLYRVISAEIRDVIKNKSALEPQRIEKFIGSNPDYYQTYELLGDYYKTAGESLRAKEMFTIALEKEKN
ncbi:MAG: hypothetical protein ACD_77C00204G0023 [uncultured bacterium]|nr:MAG: hypothetical protein ACD_77C00204G0023 [uncultured bacterium]